MTNYKQDWIDAALADGWEERPNGVWGIQKQPFERDPKWGQYVTVGRRDGDETVELRKGEFTVWFVDRIDAWGNPEMWSAGWCENGLHSIKVPETYDMDAINAEKNRCWRCKEVVAEGTLKRAGFAGFICPDCDIADYRNEVERPGWTN